MAVIVDKLDVSISVLFYSVFILQVHTLLLFSLMLAVSKTLIIIANFSFFRYSRFISYLPLLKVFLVIYHYFSSLVFLIQKQTVVGA